MARNLGQQRLGGGGPGSIAAVWLLLVLTLLVGTPWLWWKGGISERVVGPGRIGATSDGAVYHFSPFAVSRSSLRSALDVDAEGDLRGVFFASTDGGRDAEASVLLLEDGEPLGLAVGSRRELRQSNGPAYYAFGRIVYFTTADGSGK